MSPWQELLRSGHVSSVLPVGRPGVMPVSLVASNVNLTRLVLPVSLFAPL